MSSGFVTAAPTRAAFFVSSECRHTSHQERPPRRRRHFMARERREAAYRVEIERAIDGVKCCKSNEWFRALMHQDVLRKVSRGRGPRITDDAGRVLRARGNSLHRRPQYTRRGIVPSNQLQGWVR